MSISDQGAPELRPRQFFSRGVACVGLRRIDATVRQAVQLGGLCSLQVLLLRNCS